MDPWHLYFATIAGWQFHPGYNRDNAKPLTLEQCAALADSMLYISEDHRWNPTKDQKNNAAG